MAAKKFSPHGIPPPEKLKVTDDSTLSQNFRRFMRGWNNYEVATNLKAESSEFRCAIFMTMIGSDALELFESFKFAEGESEENIVTVIKKFEDYCVKVHMKLSKVFVSIVGIKNRMKALMHLLQSLES